MNIKIYLLIIIIFLIILACELWFIVSIFRSNDLSINEITKNDNFLVSVNSLNYRKDNSDVLNKQEDKEDLKSLLNHGTNDRKESNNNYVNKQNHKKVLKKEKINILDKQYLSVPFVCQAPYGNWDAPYQEGCEEASILMVHYYWQDMLLDKKTAKNEIIKLVDWQTENGYRDSVNLSDLKKIIQDYWQYDKVIIKYDITIEDIKYELSKGNPVIVPAAGRLLGNPNFTGLGPLYHMLVIKGYENNYFITNDPGTAKGEDYKYSFSVLYNSIHDFPGDKNLVLEGKKGILIIEDK
jgi:hypothetical protein